MVTAGPDPGRTGSWPTGSGAAFRVWAPNATAAAVQLLDGALAGRSVQLAAEDGGYWSADVAGAAAGDGYLYAITSGSQVLSRIDPYARRVTNSAGSAFVYDEQQFPWGNRPYQSPSWDDLVIYELHVGTFGDAPGSPVANLEEAAAFLPYLQGLGVSAVELLPVAEFAGDRSWGYNPAVPFAVESAYGGPDALKAFVQAAHDLGIGVILDVVYNHWGPGDVDHCLWQFDGWSQDGLGGIYFYQDWRRPTPWGEKNRPDYGRPEVRQYLRDNALSWLRDYRLDGLRMDMTAYIRNVDGGGDPARDIADGWLLLQEINTDITAAQPWKIVAAEDMQGNDWITRPVTDGGAGFPTQWDPDFVRQLRQAAITPDDASRDISAVAGALARQYSGRALARVIYTESHDADANGGARVPQEIDPSEPGSYWAKKRSTLAAAAVFTAPGIPMLFQGQEFLESKWFSDDRPVDWSKRGTYAGIVQMYTDLIHLRRNTSGTTAGLRGGGIQVHHVNPAGKVIAYRRWADGGPRDDTLVLLNFCSQAYDSYTIGVPGPGQWRVRLNTDWPGYDASFGGQPSDDCQARDEPRDGFPWSINVGLGPYTAIILSQDQ
jgi:1,4-alpha-glucan branching enzyme